MVANFKSSSSALPFSSALPLSITLTPAAGPKSAVGSQVPQVSFAVLLTLAAAFWLFVTLTDVLYGYTMQINAAQVFKAVIFQNCWVGSLRRFHTLQWNCLNSFFGEH